MFKLFEILGMDNQVLDIIDTKTLLLFIKDLKKDFKFDAKKFKI
jgi:hypothetical protein